MRAVVPPAALSMVANVIHNTSASSVRSTCTRFVAIRTLRPKIEALDGSSIALIAEKNNNGKSNQIKMKMKMKRTLTVRTTPP
jgi:hypothetical protein